MAVLTRQEGAKGRRSVSRAAVLLAAFAAAGLFGPDAAAQPSVEYEVKAAYLVRFAPFIGWPDNAFSSPTAPLAICVVGPDPFGGLLDRAAAGQRDGERPVIIRRLAAPDANCQIMFAGGSGKMVADELAAEKGRPVVTVTESGAPVHGIISFMLIDNHVRFDIDEAAADAVSIRVSSKLLDLAHAVNRGAQP